MRLYLLIIISLLLSCRDSPSVEKQGELPNDILKNKKEKRKKFSKTEIIWTTDHVKIWGDTSNGKTVIEYASYKFEPYISFNDFKVNGIYKGQKSAINYNSNSIAKQYKTRITDTYKSEGLNFAGHYCFVFWGCGSSCQSSAIVDLANGKVYDGPSGSLRYSFKINSKMLIVNPTDSSGFYDDCAYCYPEIWLWNENTKLFEQRKSN